MRLLTSRSRSAPGPINATALARLYAFPRERWVRANFVSTLDGSAQGPDGLSGSINTAADRRVFAVNRSLADCVMVGAGTARAENYGRIDKTLVVVSGRGVLPRGLRAKGSGRVVLATCAASGRKPTDDVWVCGDSEVDLAAVVARCATEGMPRILTEGGPHLFGDLLAAGLVNDLALTTSPRIAGGDHLRVAVAPPLGQEAELRHLLEENGTLLALWRLIGPART